MSKNSERAPSIRSAIRAAVHNQEGEFRVADIVAALSDQIPEGVVRPAVYSMEKARLVRRVGPGVWVRADQAIAEASSEPERRQGGASLMKVVGTLETHVLLRPSTDEGLGELWVARRLLPSDLV